MLQTVHCLVVGFNQLSSCPLEWQNHSH